MHYHRCASTPPIEELIVDRNVWRDWRECERNNSEMYLDETPALKHSNLEAMNQHEKKLIQSAAIGSNARCGDVAVACAAVRIVDRWFSIAAPAHGGHLDILILAARPSFHRSVPFRTTLYALSVSVCVCFSPFMYSSFTLFWFDVELQYWNESVLAPAHRVGHWSFLFSFYHFFPFVCVCIGFPFGSLSLACTGVSSSSFVLAHVSINSFASAGLLFSLAHILSAFQRPQKKNIDSPDGIR